jgi:hypothetical protein
MSSIKRKGQTNAYFNDKNNSNDNNKSSPNISNEMLRAFSDLRSKSGGGAGDLFPVSETISKKSTTNETLKEFSNLRNKSEDPSGDLFPVSEIISKKSVAIDKEFKTAVKKVAKKIDVKKAFLKGIYEKDKELLIEEAQRLKRKREFTFNDDNLAVWSAGFSGIWFPISLYGLFAEKGGVWEQIMAPPLVALTMGVVGGLFVLDRWFLREVANPEHDMAMERVKKRVETAYRVPMNNKVL